MGEVNENKCRVCGGTGKVLGQGSDQGTGCPACVAVHLSDHRRIFDLGVAEGRAQMLDELEAEIARVDNALVATTDRLKEMHEQTMRLNEEAMQLTENKAILTRFVYITKAKQKK